MKSESITQSLANLKPLNIFVDPANRIYWLYLLFALVLAIAVYILSESKRTDKPLLSYLFPKEVYFNASAITDYWYFFVNGIIFFLLLAPMLLSTNWIAQQSESLIALTGLSSEILYISPIIASLLLLIGMDFGLFLGHYLSHRLPILWEFHKVHHSAEVMTPITVFRMHPVDDVLNLSITSCIMGVIAGLISHIGVGPISFYSVSGANIFLIAYYMFGYNLRHSHIWLSYGQKASHILISPAQHQIHHSSLAKHWDKNFGFIFAFWDWAFGTLYVPKEKETFPLGIGGEEKEYSSVWRLYHLPFVKALRRAIKKSK